MPLLSCAIALAAVTVLYLVWRSYRTSLFQRHRVLRERVAHLLWVAADVDDAPPPRKGSRPVDKSLDVA